MSDLTGKINSDTILDCIVDGVVVISPDHKVLYINRAASEMLGRAGDQEILCGASCSDVVGHSACTLGCLINSTIKTGEHIYNYEAVLGKGDRKITLSINTALLKDEDGKVIGGVEMFRDVTLIKELKAELKGRYSLNNVIGKNYKMHEVYELLHEVSPTKASVYPKPKQRPFPRQNGILAAWKSFNKSSWQKCGPETVSEPDRLLRRRTPRWAQKTQPPNPKPHALASH